MGEMKNGYEIATEMLLWLSPWPVRVTTDDGRGDLRSFASIEEARAVLEGMLFFVAPGEDVAESGWCGNPRPQRADDYTFALWSTDAVGYLDLNEGFADPVITPRTPEAWLEQRARHYR